jgi:predicted metal-dependent hydrolase
VDYIVVHELAHRLEMNHSKAFYRIVESVLPDYQKAQKWLRENGRNL